MGWTVFEREPRNGWKAYLDESLGDGNELVASKIASDGVYYCAIKSDGVTFAVVALIEGSGYKVLDEDMGPYAYECPPEILDVLSPARSKYAEKWRAGCRALRLNEQARAQGFASHADQIAALERAAALRAKVA